jgi:hypothetical protein
MQPMIHHTPHLHTDEEARDVLPDYRSASPPLIALVLVALALFVGALVAFSGTVPSDSPSEISPSETLPTEAPDDPGLQQQVVP